MLIQNNFRSWCLQTNTDVDIIIPDVPNGADPKKFYSSENRFKVLWLLHGTYGGYNDFVRRTNIDLYAKECNIMVVMPNGINTGYSNWPDFGIGYNMYDYITEELMPMIHGFFPASSKREDNIIGGLSMGSMGATKFAVNHPDKFGGCLAMSGTPSNIEKQYREGTLQSRALNSIANAGGIEKYLDSYENVWGLCKDLAKADNCPDFYFCCGTDDFLFDSYMEFKKYAQEIGLKATFDEVEGYGHEWRLWDLELQKGLQHFGWDTGKRNITKATDFKDSKVKSLL